MKKILVFGGSGLVGSKFIELCPDFKIKAPDVSALDILNVDALSGEFDEVNPDLVINFAAYTAVEEAEKQKGDKNGICYRINVFGAQNVASVCRRFSKRLIHISTEYVFDGTKSESPYTEEDKPNPINWYGQTKYFGEAAVLESGCQSTVVRICMPFSSRYELKKDVARFFLEQLRAGNPITAIEDQKITPTLVDDIAGALKTVVVSGTAGLYHVSSTTTASPFGFAKLIAETFGLDASLVKPVSLDEYNKNKTAKLLKYSWLDSSKFDREFSGVLHTINEGVRLFKSQTI